MAVFVPYLRDYAPFYIQREGDATATDIQKAYGITVRAQKYPMQRKVKTPYKNDFKDRHGDDEWTGKLYYESISYSIDCCILTNEADSESSRSQLKAQVKAFQMFLQDGSFSFYSAWTKFGFRKVRLDEFPELDSDGFDNLDGHCRLLFTVTFKINDPVTNMVLSGNKIVEE